MCEKFQIVCVRLNQSKSVEGYDNQITLKFIIYVIYSTFIVKGYKELTTSMFITHLKH